jgi:hypothetical protein
VSNNLNTEQAALYVNRSASSLAKLRLYGGGPTYMKLGRSVRYGIADLDAWLAAGRRANTAQA